MGFKLKRRTLADDLAEAAEIFRADQRLILAAAGLADDPQPTLAAIDLLIERLRVARQVIVTTVDLVHEQRRTQDDPVIGAVDDVTIILKMGDLTRGRDS